MFLPIFAKDPLFKMRIQGRCIATQLYILLHSLTDAQKDVTTQLLCFIFISIFFCLSQCLVCSGTNIAALLVHSVSCRGPNDKWGQFTLTVNVADMWILQAVHVIVDQVKDSLSNMRFGTKHVI